MKFDAMEFSHYFAWCEQRAADGMAALWDNGRLSIISLSRSCNFRNIAADSPPRSSHC
jgi:hypothetical protein